MCLGFRTTNLRLITAIFVICTAYLIPEHGATSELTQNTLPKINIELRSGLLSVQAEKAALVDVLKVISQAANFRLVLYGNFQTPVDQSFRNVLIDEGIRRLAENHSVAMVYHTVLTPETGKNQENLSEVYVFDTKGSLQTTIIDNDDDLDRTTKREEQMPLEFSQTPQQFSKEVMHGLNQFREESAVSYWVRILAQNQDRTIREQAITELKWIGSDEAITAIATALGDQDEVLRRHAVESIGSITSNLSTQLLGQVLIGDPDAEIRMAAVRLLAKRLNEPSRAFLNIALKDKDVRISTLAKRALTFYNQ